MNNDYKNTARFYDKGYSLQGDHRDNIKKFIIKENIISEEFIKVHGF